MINFLMLGQVPGTSIHITFFSWLLCALLVMLAYTVYYDRNHEHRLWFAICYFSVAMTMRTKTKYLDRAARLIRRTAAVLLGRIAAAWSARYENQAPAGE